MAKILITLNEAPDGMHPSQLFYSEAHLKEWIPSVADKIKDVTYDLKAGTVSYRLASDPATRETPDPNDKDKTISTPIPPQRAGTIETKPDDFHND